LTGQPAAQYNIKTPEIEQKHQLNTFLSQKNARSLLQTSGRQQQYFVNIKTFLSI